MVNNNVTANNSAEPQFDLGFNNAEYILPDGNRNTDVVLLEGPPGTFKQTIALNFLIRGLVCGENVLLIELSDKTSFVPTKQKRVSESVLFDVRKALYLNYLYETKKLDINLPYSKAKKKKFDNIMNSNNYLEILESAIDNINLHRGCCLWFQDYKNIFYPKGRKNKDRLRLRNEVYGRLFHEEKANEINNTKICKTVSVFNERFNLINVAFKSGYILPEEFIQEIRKILLEAESHRKPIKRIVFSDLELLGVSYPLLKSSRTAGDLFLTAFAHIIRNYQNISLLMTGTTGQYSQADEMIGRARALSDVVLKTSFCDVFGNRYIVLEGEGLTTRSGKIETNEEKEYGEYSPGVIVPKEHSSTSIFEVDMERMEGLVGFDTQNLHRPGVVFYAFEEGSIQKRYNESIEDTLSYTLGLPRRRMNELIFKNIKPEEKDIHAKDINSDARVYVESFKAMESEALHSSLRQLIGKPLSKTVICTVDEFALSREMQGSIAENAFIDLGKFDIQSRTLIDDLERVKEQNRNYVWPYYVNILFLAYRTKDQNGCELNSIKYLKHNALSSWNKVLQFSKKLQMDLEPHSKSTPPLFDYFRYVDETLSCVLLDALASKIRKNKGENLSKADWDKILAPKNSKLYDEQVNEIRALQKLLLASESAKTEFGEKHNNLQEEIPHIRSDAGVFLVWYSQLRELLEYHPFLADKLGFCALPGGGFRGNWYIGVSKGSVSKKLGKSLIRTLCSQKEQYKRFARGVGLPIFEEFYKKKNKFYPWPYVDYIQGSNANRCNPKMIDFLQIYKGTNTRINIEGYPEFRNILFMVCKQLIRKKYMECNIKHQNENIRNNVERLFAQIALFKNTKDTLSI